MLMVGTWKRSRWKQNVKQLSTLYQPANTLVSDIVSTNVCITRYTKCGQLDVARKVFDEMPIRTVVSWNAMVSGYSKWGRFSEALSLVSIMHHGNVRLNETTFLTTLGVCARSGSLSEGRELHCSVLKTGTECFELVGSSLLHFYSNCLKIEDAKRVFDELRGGNELLWSLMLVGYVQCNLMGDAMELFLKMPKWDVVAWTTLISGYAKNEDGCERALELFQWMRGSGEVGPNEFTLDCVIRAYGRLGVLCAGKAVHGLLIKYGFEFEESICGTLIEFYCDSEAVHCAKRVYDRLENPCLNASNSLIGGLVLMDRIEDAERIFCRLKEKNPVSYNLMIKGYAMSGQVDQSKRLFENMKHRTMISSNTMISLIKTPFQSNVYVGTSLIDMYSKSDNVLYVKEMFMKLAKKSLVSWNVMIAVYVNNSMPGEAVDLFLQLEVSGIEPDAVTIASVLPACGDLSALLLGKRIHEYVERKRLRPNLLLENALIDMYAKCGCLQDAREVFDAMKFQDVVSWTSMMSAYGRNGRYDEALESFDSMSISGQCPNEFTLSSVLRSCSLLGDFDYGTRIHAYVIKLGFESNQYLGSTMIDLYAKCGFTDEACKIFRNMDNRDTISWTTIISSLVQAEKFSQALAHYMDMICAGVHPNEFTFVKLLAASYSLGLNYGKLLHAHLIRLGMRLNLVLKTALVNMYSKYQKMEDAIKVSNQTPDYDVLLWTSVISGFTKSLRVTDAIAALREMELSGIVPNNFTYSSILKASSEILSLELGKQIHSRIIKAGLEYDTCAGGALVDMYMKCSDLAEDALEAFRDITSPSVITWTSLIAGFSEHGFEKDSFQSFAEMRAVGVQPNSFTLSSILRACSTVKSHSQTVKLHGLIVKTKAGCDTVVGNALVDAYAALGMVDDAWHVVTSMIHRDAITYTCLATRMNQMCRYEVALDVIVRMYMDDVEMDGFSMASFLSSSAGLAAMETGRQLHCYSIKAGLASGISVSNALVDLYGKCGCTDDAYRAFKGISEPDIVSWNGLISGLASTGHISSALSTFDDMRLAGFKPDSITFLLVLFACSHGGLVELGLEHFQSMREKHEIAPQLDHYACLVDLLGRAGRLEDAMEVIMTMPFKPDALIYKTLLGACKSHRNIALGEYVARQGIELDPSDPAFYVLL
ncbi:PREDICTED: pentatricopeptide, partial [Prunus dulcis]